MINFVVSRQNSKVCEINFGRGGWAKFIGSKVELLYGKFLGQCIKIYMLLLKMCILIRRLEGFHMCMI